MYIYVCRWVRKQHIFIPWGGGKNKRVSLAACVCLLYVSSEPGSASCPLSILRTLLLTLLSVPEVHTHVGA